MTHDELIIVGAGPAGLTLSSRHPGRSRVLEQDHEVGGLCRSIEFGGGVFDIGGHSFHTPYPEVARLVEGLMEGRWETQRRDARVFFQGALIDYPFQGSLDQIADTAVAEECRRGLPPGKEAASAADNFEDWVGRRFGPGIARHFMLPYNRKLWARDLRRMSCEWVGERIAGGTTAQTPPPARTRSALKTDTVVGYPAEGGFAEIFRAMAARCGPIEFGQRLVSIDPQARLARTASGVARGWDHLVSTIPLPALLRSIEGCPDALIRDADQLEAVSLKVLLLLVQKSPGERPQRVYVADPEVPAHKIAFNHLSSAALRKCPREAIMCEISYSDFKPPAPDAHLIRTMVEWLAASRLIGGAGDVVEARVLDVPFGYPVPTPARSDIVARIRAYLAGLGIFTIGRFGGWNYANSDACIREALDLAELLSDGQPGRGQRETPSLPRA